MDIEIFYAEKIIFVSKKKDIHDMYFRYLYNYNYINETFAFSRRYNFDTTYIPL